MEDYLHVLFQTNSITTYRYKEWQINHPGSHNIETVSEHPHREDIEEQKNSDQSIISLVMTSRFIISFEWITIRVKTRSTNCDGLPEDGDMASHCGW